MQQFSQQFYGTVKAWGLQLRRTQTQDSKAGRLKKTTDAHKGRQQLEQKLNKQKCINPDDAKSTGSNCR